jgi:hypothetical protein
MRYGLVLSVPTMVEKLKIRERNKNGNKRQPSTNGDGADEL